MNIEQLVKSISEQKYRDDLSLWIGKWKKDETDIDELYGMIDKWHGNVWFKNQSNQNEFYNNLQKFKSDVVDKLEGMTVNERLYCFGLFDEWDYANNSEQDRIRNKIKASL